MKPLLLFMAIFLCRLSSSAQTQMQADADTVILCDARFQLKCYKNTANLDSLWDLQASVIPSTSDSTPCYRVTTPYPLNCHFMVCCKDSVFGNADLLRIPDNAILKINGRPFTGAIEAMAAISYPELHIVKGECLVRIRYTNGQCVSSMSRESHPATPCTGSYQGYQYLCNERIQLKGNKVYLSTETAAASDSGYYKLLIYPVEDLRFAKGEFRQLPEEQEARLLAQAIEKGPVYMNGKPFTGRIKLALGFTTMGVSTGRWYSGYNLYVLSFKKGKQISSTHVHDIDLITERVQEREE